MKEAILFTCVILTLILLLVSCSETLPNTPEPTNKTVEESSKDAKISIYSPMTLSSNNMYPLNGNNQYLRLRMVAGKYSEDWNPGAYMGTLWEGKYIIELADESGNTITQTDLSKYFKEPLVFNSSFDIQFDDYNNDGDLDFTLGQYATSNGNDFKLFTLRKNGNVEELSIKDYPTLFISKKTGYYSTKLTKVSNITFSKQYYDNSKQKNFEDIFKWDGKEFIHIKSQELKENN
ncbi:hypothetical protein [Acetivibrio cellulolyticus]|uniref:hypothetical protein n=1 Tax=Acetivibrio cellulolyticus TaxID=35830 RepID=UPI0001E2CBC7|nr:hypothetical protein [Acetivibrio cellulolyticus]